MNNNNNKSEDILIGVDLGTTYSAVTYIDVNNEKIELVDDPQSCRFTPTVIFFNGDPEQTLYGTMAQQQLQQFPQNTFYVLKRILGVKFSTNIYFN